jgi:hypothetical protein
MVHRSYFLPRSLSIFAIRLHMDPPRAGSGRSISAQGALIIHGVK